MSLQAPLVCDNFSVFLCFLWPWESWGELATQLCTVPESGFIWCFPHETAVTACKQVPFLSQCFRDPVTPTGHQWWSLLHHWGRWCLPRFSTVRLPFLSSHTLFLGSRSLCPARSWGLEKEGRKLHILKGVSTLIKWNSPKDFSLIYILFIHFFILVWTHGYLFYTLGYDPILPSFIGLDDSVRMPLCPPFLSTSLLHDTIRWSRLIFCPPCCSPGISHFFKEPWFFLLENGT